MSNILDNGMTYLVANRPLVLYFELDNGHQYVTTVRHDVSLTEVANEDVPQMLIKRCGCCDSYWLCFRRASDAEVALWNKPI